MLELSEKYFKATITKMPQEVKVNCSSRPFFTLLVREGYPPPPPDIWGWPDT